MNHLPSITPPRILPHVAPAAVQKARRLVCTPHHPVQLPRVTRGMEPAVAAATCARYAALARAALRAAAAAVLLDAVFLAPLMTAGFAACALGESIKAGVGPCSHRRCQAVQHSGVVLQCITPHAAGVGKHVGAKRPRGAKSTRRSACRKVPPHPTPRQNHADKLSPCTPPS